ncbi:uncharacterized protein BCF33_1027 [Hasllibacter halocynthiae]|uniref:Mth938-like domain-containing protein n=1 Tax=Hasllibacter halocynthiae TaxID=595589 RepID=A0A2T0X8Y7_9RHOB|nr:Mth938-like domain-containing protein [Hasllibacter halocynthiae]PRY95408.1 uncharacterized protein BCF33_1027 [Hasllibacter halocynthiae]
MNLNEVTYSSGVPVDGYGPTYWTIGARRWDGAVLILPTGPARWTPGDAAPFLAAAEIIDVLLLGTGARIAHAPHDFRAALEKAGVGVEVMASPQAARTYNVLLGEGRRVGVALMPLD